MPKAHISFGSQVIGVQPISKEVGKRDRPPVTDADLHVVSVGERREGIMNWAGPFSLQCLRDRFESGSD